jgi:rhamnosyltransferase
MHYLVDAVFVTYYPNINLFKDSLSSIVTQVRSIYVIDNSGCVEVNCALKKIISSLSSVSLTTLSKNMGIGHAQNIGLRDARNNKADLILLSDQDTIYPENYIGKMILNFNSIADNSDIAAIVPNFRDTNKNGKVEGFFQLDGVNAKKIESDVMCEEVSQAIASGMIVNNKLLSEIGMMNEAFFIDWVDFEWCWRATSKGYKIIGCKNVIISHKLGDASIDISGRTYSLHSPERNYYIIRNGISIALTEKNLALKMRWGIFFKSIRYMIGFIIFTDQHIKNIRYCAIGFYDGLVGKLGPFSNHKKVAL